MAGHKEIKDQIVGLVNQIMQLERQHKALEELGDPKKAKCGCPGFGHKAARKHRNRAAEVAAEIRLLNFNLNHLAGNDSKRLTPATRQQRQEYIKSARSQWELNNPMPTIDSIQLQEA